MSIAYVDTSALVAIAFEEPGGSQAGERLEGFSRLLSSNLLEAELRRGVFARERQKFDAEVLSSIEWILPRSAPGYRAGASAGDGLPAGCGSVAHRHGALHRAKSRGDWFYYPSTVRNGEVACSSRVSGRDRLADCRFRLGLGRQQS